MKQKFSAKCENESLLLGVKGPSSSAPSSLTSRKTFAHPPPPKSVHVSPSTLVEVNGVQSEAFVLSHTIHHGCLLLPLLYVLALEPFLHKLQANLALWGMSLLDATTSVR